MTNKLINSVFLLGLSALIFTTSCNNEEPASPITRTIPKDTTQRDNSVDNSGYFGCWKEATGKPLFYDILITESTPNHDFAILLNCGGTVISSQNIGSFSNDTLILDNGINEYFAYLKDDTLYYHVGGNSDFEKYVKN